MAGAPASELTKQLETLQKVLNLERRKGFSDTAMTGGLEAFVQRSVQQANELGQGVEIFRELALTLADYAELPDSVRRSRVSEAERIIQTVPGVPKADSPPPSGADKTPTATRRQSPARRKPSVRLQSLDDPISVIPGVGENREEQLRTLGIRTVRDMLYFAPRRHEDYSRLSPISSLRYNAEYTVRGTITHVQEQPLRNNRRMITVTITDQSGSLPVIFFNHYVLNQLKPGLEIAVSGRIERQNNAPCLRSPEWEILEGESIHTGRLVPFYPLVRGLFQKQVRNLTRRTLDIARESIADPLPPAVRDRNGLIDLGRALEALHYPQSTAEYAAARQRLAFDEFLVLQFGLLRRKVDWKRQEGQSFPPDQEKIDYFIGSLPFRLTDAQRRSLDEITADLANDEPMSRLLQGDVGSGKTVVAAIAAYTIVLNGAQVAILAPTEILAEQHARTFEQIFRELPSDRRPATALLTGSTPAARRREIDEQLASGSLHVLIGTHAILEDHVGFHRLGMAIIDEQHRFGVRQRARLRAKGMNPDILVMTATPIPRSLALVMHGDLDVSIIDELPPGRQSIITARRTAAERPKVHRFIRDQVVEGRQAFVIYPLVEESDKLDLKAATNEAERLSTEVFPDLKVGLLHGRMKPAEKDDVMAKFRDREIDILVATSVVEVGIDVPNATVMVIEGAERFGLSQLHQFRGRVGRGAAQSYCILLTSDDADGPTSQKRLDAIVGTQDGFKLAEIDLELRGPGEFFGTRQSGIPELAFAGLTDMKTLNASRIEAQNVLDIDPELDLPEHNELKGAIQRFWVEGMGDLS